MHDYLLDSPGIAGSCGLDAESNSCRTVSEPIVEDIKMIVIVQTTQIFAHDILHLVVELEAIKPSLLEENAQTIFPLVYEQESPSYFYSVVISSHSCRFGKSQSSACGEQISSQGSSWRVVAQSIEIVSIVAEDIANIIAVCSHNSSRRSCNIFGPSVSSSNQRRNSGNPVHDFTISRIIRARTTSGVRT